MESFNNTNITTTIEPTLPILTYNQFDDDKEQRRVTGAGQVLLISLYYMVFFPVVALCGYAIVQFLRRRGHISQREAATIMEDHQNTDNNNNNNNDIGDAENPDLARLDELEWYSAFHFASEVIGGRCSIELLRICREYEAISLVEEYYKWWNKTMTLRAICTKAIEKFFVTSELPGQLRKMM